jgi:hypothetical protein
MRLAAACSLPERARKRERLAADLGARGIRLEFTRTADRELDDHRGKRREQGSQRRHR